MIRMRLLAAACVLACTACVSNAPATSSDGARERAHVNANDALSNAITGAWRSQDNRARDIYRHPTQTLGFFGIRPTDTVIEITPGSGW